MSDIRFFHCNDLRLGSCIQGLINSPSWLQTLAENAFRQSTRNLIDQAIARQVDFVLVSGTICDSAEDLDAAVRWLVGEKSRLNKRGIRLVLSAGSPEQAEKLRPAADEIIRTHESLNVRQRDQISLEASAGVDPHADLVIRLTSQRYDGAAITYEAVSASATQPIRAAVSTDGYLVAAAGPIQTACSRETTPCGAVLVEVDRAARSVRATPVFADVLRFTNRTVEADRCDQPDQIVDDLLRAGQELSEDFGGTTVVDWLVRTHLNAGEVQLGDFRTAQLLRQLQTQLHGGHRGIWARRIQYTDDSAVHNTTSDTLLEHFLVVQSRARGSSGLPVSSARLTDTHIAALALLQDAA